MIPTYDARPPWLACFSMNCAACRFGGGWLACLPWPCCLCLCCRYVAALPWAALLSVALVAFSVKTPLPLWGLACLPLRGLASGGTLCAALPLLYNSTRRQRLQVIFGVFDNFDVLHNASRLFLLDLHKKRCVAF